MLKMKRRIAFPLAIALFLQVIFSFNTLYARESKEVILVLDTSMSMLGSGGSGYKSKNIFERVKKSVNEYIDKLEDGDRVTFMTFDERIKVYPTVYVDDDNDRDIIKKYITMTEAAGKWTYTYKMLQEVFKKAEDLEKQKEGRQTLIVIMSDALDDPPPDMRNRKFNLKEIAPTQKDWWIYFVSFSSLKEDKKLAKIRESLEKQLKEVTKYAKVLDGGSDPEKALGKDFQRDLSQVEGESSRTYLFIAIAVVVLLLLLFLIYYFKRQGELKVLGRLEYWKVGVIDHYIESYDLKRKPSRVVSVGRGIGCTLNIRDFELDIPFEIGAVRDKNTIRVVLQSSERYPIEYINKKESKFLEDGDIFRVANYAFKYFAQ